MRSVVTANMVVLSDRVLEQAWVVVEGEVIAEIGTGAAPRVQGIHCDGWLVPGFVDAHVHGGGGGTFSEVDGIGVAIEYLTSRGTTGFSASLISDSIPSLARQIRNLIPYVDTGEIAAIHLEGPFLSALRCGAHAPEMLCTPTRADVDALIATIAGRPAMITIAPELPDALQAIRRFSEAGVLVALGHSDTDASMASAGLDAGARVVTHLFNAMRPMHHREPGLAEVALTDVRAVPELILDGLHVSRLTAEIAMASAAGRWIAVTDSAYVAGLPDGRYSLGGGIIDLFSGSVRAVDSGALAGSTASMADCFSRLIKNHGLSPLEAVSATASRPADVLGIPEIGHIRVGARADLVLWEQGAVSAVMRRGVWIA